jgi:A/G-specific adenine glycosylase
VLFIVLFQTTAKMNLTYRILFWYENNQRELPWRSTSDPYKIWLSEIILQQTRIAQGLDYYHRFTRIFPDIFTLAKATEDEVLSAWQGLGYYSRARNLHYTAKNIVTLYNGEFPADYKKLLALKGIGVYTAAAIASMAFNIPVAAVDGNVTRVLARLFGIDAPVDQPHVRKEIQKIANELIDQVNPGFFNQAMMDFGSLVCKPNNPSCQSCPFSQECVARLNGKTEQIPLKTKKAPQRNRFFHFFFLYYIADQKVCFFVEKRNGNDIWKNLYQLPMLEYHDEDFQSKDITHQFFENKFQAAGIETIIDQSPDRYIHQLTHQRIYAFFHRIPITPLFCATFEEEFLKVTFEEFDNMAKPVLMDKFLSKLKDVTWG